MKKRFIFLFVALLWAVACWWFFQYEYCYHLFYKEQNQLFLLTADYARTYFAKPAWAACLAGDAITQLYYYQYAGAALLTAVLLLMLTTVCLALRRCGLPLWCSFTIAIAATTAEAVCHLQPAFTLSSTIAIIGGCALFLTPAFGRPWGAIIGTALAYWLFGVGAWVYLLLIAINCRKRQHWLFAASAAAVFAACIIILRPAYLLTTTDMLTYPGIGKLKKPNYLLESDLAVDCEYYFGNHQRVVERVEKSDVLTEEMLFFYNLVMAQRGLLPDVLLKYQPNQLGTFYHIGPETPLITIKNMNELYFALGDMTFTERAAMMACVFSTNNRNVRMVKRLAECALVSGDTAAAGKYLGVLSHTLCYKRWAEQAPKDPAYAQKARFNNRQDTLALTDNAHFLMMQLLDSNPNNVVALDYILCSDLLLKDITNFKRDYDRYCSERPRPKTLYQEALCIWLAGTQAPPEEWQRYIQRPDVLQRFADYNRQRGSEAFKDTYWYFFDRGEKAVVD